jgi:hypothetical protein
MMLVLATSCAGRGCPSEAETVKEKLPMNEPKQIRFYEGDQLVRTEAAANVPDEIRYVTVEGKRVEVAKIVANTLDDTRTIEQYDANGGLLLRTLQRKFSPPPADGSR